MASVTRTPRAHPAAHPSTEQVEQLRLIPSKAIAFVRFKYRACAEVTPPPHPTPPPPPVCVAVSFPHVWLGTRRPAVAEPAGKPYRRVGLSLLVTYAK